MTNDAGDAHSATGDTPSRSKVLGLPELDRLVATVQQRQAQLNEDAVALRYLFRLQTRSTDT